MPSSSATKDTLLTGASGFTGRYLEPALQAHGYRVMRADPAGSQPCDLTDPQAVEEVVLRSEPHTVIHLAAVTYVAHGNAEDFYRVNVAWNPKSSERPRETEASAEARHYCQ